MGWCGLLVGKSASHICVENDLQAMVSRTVSLEEGAYVRLKVAKRPGESFSEVVNRVLTKDRPTFLSLGGFLSRSEAKDAREAINKMRELEARGATRVLKRQRLADGADARR